MWEWLTHTDGYTPRMLCGPSWTQGLIAVSNFADLSIFIAYMLIPVGIVRIYRRLAAGVPVPNIRTGILLGMSFILLCGLTHLSDRLMFIWPAYRLDTVLRVACALASLATVLWLSMIDLHVEANG